jgi:putative ABC transport system ATP-binding protein
LEVFKLALLEFYNVSYKSDDRFIINDLTVNIKSGDFISIVGPSGSGKSTFLKLCSHLYSPCKGKILFKGQDIMECNPTDLRKTICYCFQTPYLFGRTVMDNIEFPFKIRNIQIDINKINQLFYLFNMDKEFLHKEITNLSGGEKQRIALIRSLIFKPEVLLLDEVTSALDIDNTKIVEDVVNKLNKEGMTILWITHNPIQSRKYASRIITIENGLLKSLEVLK